MTRVLRSLAKEPKEKFSYLSYKGIERRNWSHSFTSIKNVLHFQASILRRCKKIDDDSTKAGFYAIFFSKKTYQNVQRYVSRARS